MATPNQLSSLPFQNNAILNGLNKPDNSKLVYDLSGGFNVIDFIVTRNAPARQITGLNGQFQKPIMGRSDVGIQIASNAATGNNLIVNFSDPTFQNFRVTEVIGDGTAANNQGRVISVAPGTVTLEPVSGATSLTTSAFVAGGYASRLFQASINHGSNGIASLYEDPIYVQNQTSIIRESLDVYRRDAFNTWVEYDGDFWIHSQEPITMRRFARGLERKAIFGKMGTNTTSASGGGTVNYSMGLKDSILNPLRGGVYMGLTGAMTEGQFQNWISQIADRKNSTKYKITLGVGRGFLAMVQNFVRPFIQFGGSQNTFNFDRGASSIKGLDAYFYAFNGVEVEMIMIPMFNDREQFPTMSTYSGLGNYTRMQYTAIAFDTDMYPSMGGGMLPAMEKVYFGPQETLYGYVRGMTDTGSGNVPNLSTSGYINLATDRDAVSIQIYSDCAYDFMSYRMGWAEVLA